MTPLPVAKEIQGLLQKLHGILDQLAAPELLSGEEVGELVASWERYMTRLESYTDRFPEGVTPGDGTRERIMRLIERIAEVQPLVVLHKSAVADQLFSQNRRVNSLRQGYGAIVGGASLFYHKA